MTSRNQESLAVEMAEDLDETSNQSNGALSYADISSLAQFTERILDYIAG